MIVRAPAEWPMELTFARTDRQIVDACDASLHEPAIVERALRWGMKGAPALPYHGPAATACCAVGTRLSYSSFGGSPRPASPSFFPCLAS